MFETETLEKTDSGTIDFQIRRDSLRKTPQGFWIVDISASRTGVQAYIDINSPNGVRRELRHPDDVFHPDSLASFVNAPITRGHPPVMVDADNATEYTRGIVLDKPRVEKGKNGGEDLVVIEAIIYDGSLIRDIESGELAQASVGYHARVVMDSGVWNGNVYDARQKDIRANHVAIVKHGRGGSDVRVRLDSAPDLFFFSKQKQKGNPMRYKEYFDSSSGYVLVLDAHESESLTSGHKPGEEFRHKLTKGPDKGYTKIFRVNPNGNAIPVRTVEDPEGNAVDLPPIVNSNEKEDKHKKNDGGPPMTKIEVGEVRVDVSESAALAITQHLKDVKSKLDESTQKTEELQGKYDQSQADLKEAKEKLDAAQKVDVHKLAQERSYTINKAAPFLPKEAKLDELDNNQIRAMALKSRYDQDFSEKSSEYIAGRFDDMIANYSNVTGHSPQFKPFMDAAAGTPTLPREDEEEDEGLSAYQDMIDGLVGAKKEKQTAEVK